MAVRTCIAWPRAAGCRGRNRWGRAPPARCGRGRASAPPLRRPVHSHGSDARAEPLGQFGKRLLVPPGGYDALRAHAQRDRDGGAAEAAGRAIDENGFPGLQPCGEKPAIGHQQRTHRAPAPGIPCVDGADRRGVFRRQPHLFGPCAVMEVALQGQAGFAAGGQALQRDVGRARIVARAHGRIAIDPVADAKPRRIGSGGADAADRAGTEHNGSSSRYFRSPLRTSLCRRARGWPRRRR